MSSSRGRLLNVVGTPLTDAMGQTGTYTGSIVVSTGEGVPHGNGCMEYQPSMDAGGNNKYGKKSASCWVRLYDGEWSQGKWHGNGKAVMSNDDVYIGQFVEGMRNGTGTYEWTKQNRWYHGDFSKNQRHGHGTYIWNKHDPAISSKYIGGFQFNKRQGNGTYTTPQMEFKGEFKNGQFHGYGSLSTYEQPKQSNEDDKTTNTSTTPTRVYRGNWVNGKRDGYGVETNQDGTIRHDGDWKQDQPILPMEGQEEQDKQFQRTTTYPHHHAQGNLQSTATPSKVNNTSTGNENKDQLLLVNGVMIHDALGRVGHFRGMVEPSNRLPQGVGVMTYDLTGSKKLTNIYQYDGFWDNGHFSGQGRVQYSNGDVFSGDMKSSLRHGRGELKCKSGRTYKGFFQDDVRHGENCIMLYENGEYYEGEFRNNQREGNEGKYVFKDGSVYRGGWKSGLFHGTGELVDAAKKILYKGEFEEGKPAKTSSPLSSAESMLDDVPAIPTPLSDDNGIALDELVDSKKVEQNQTTQPVPAQEEPSKPVVNVALEDGQGNSGRYTGLLSTRTERPHGVGRMVYDDGLRVHEGFWVHGHRQGHGRCIFIKIGDFHEGEYHQNVRHGEGRYVWSDGRVFDGMYREDEREGLGTFEYPNGDIYQGYFKHGQRNGKGTFVFRKRTCRYDGDWGDGMYNGSGRLQWQPKPSEVNVYEGEFKDGQFSGFGTHSINNALSRQGIWEKGRFRQAVSVKEATAQSNKQDSAETEEATIAIDAAASARAPIDVVRATPTADIDELSPSAEQLPLIKLEDSTGTETAPKESIATEDAGKESIETEEATKESIETEEATKESIETEEATKDSTESEETTKDSAETKEAPKVDAAIEEEGEGEKNDAPAPPAVDEPPLPRTARPSTNMSKRLQQTLPLPSSDETDGHKTTLPTLSREAKQRGEEGGEDDEEAEPFVDVAFSSSNNDDDVVIVENAASGMTITESE